jgi:protein TonB
MIRGKRPEANLKRTYGKVLWICMGISTLLNAAFIFLMPNLGVKAYEAPPQPIIIELEEIPETRQERKPPPPPRPAVPIATDDTNVPDDVTIEITDLDLDLDDFAPPAPLHDLEEVELEEEEDEVVDIWSVEKRPKETKTVAPEYPEIARKAGLTGLIVVVVQLDKQGKVEKILQVIGEPKVFHEAAKEAAQQWEFSPAIQNDKPVRVRVQIPFKFQLE